MQAGDRAVLCATRRVLPEAGHIAAPCLEDTADSRLGFVGDQPHKQPLVHLLLQTVTLPCFQAAVNPLSPCLSCQATAHLVQRAALSNGLMPSLEGSCLPTQARAPVIEFIGQQTA